MATLPNPDSLPLSPKALTMEQDLFLMKTKIGLSSMSREELENMILSILGYSMFQKNVMLEMMLTYAPSYDSEVNRGS